MVKKKHIHWVAGRKWKKRISHPISQKHRTTEGKLQHDLKTKKFQRWAKRKKLYLLDSTYRRYINEVLKKRR